MTLGFHIGAATNTGVERDVNQDSYAFAPGFELWLDQCRDGRVVCQQRKDIGKDQPQRNETHIKNRQIGRFAEIFRRQCARVALLHRHQFLPVRELWRKLPAANINGVDQRCSALQQHVGKTAGGCADI